MSFIAADPHRFLGRTAGPNGHCVAFVQEVTTLGVSTTWRRGDPAHGSNVAPLTAIATFDARGRYASRTDGSSHCAILLAAHSDGSITVLDQWLSQPVHERIIRDRAGAGDAANDASRFYVVEVA